MTNTTEYSNTLPSGYCLQEYKIQKVLGVGGFGITYLAEDMQLNHNVAIKEYFPNELAVREHSLSVKPKYQQDEDNFRWGLDRFIEEGRTLATFKHPNIVRVLRYFEAHNSAYIVMEYEQGQSLSSLIKDGETATEAEIMAILSPILDGLEVVHKTGYLHRDIKPGNIYVRTSDNSPVLIDFGAARYDVGSRSRTLTAIFSPGYAPFEQYENRGNRQGAWTDIYALGAVLYKLISGKAPIESSERIGYVVRHNPDPLIPAIEIGREYYSPRLLEAIDWALKINEQERPQTIGKWRDKLFTQPVIPPTDPVPAHNNKGWKPSVVIGTIAVLLLIIMGGMYYFMSLQPLSNTKQHLAEIEARLAEAEQARLKAETEALLAKAEQARLQAEAKLAVAEQARLQAETSAKIAAEKATEERTRRERISQRVAAQSNTYSSQTPAQFIRDYYEGINNRQYQKTWAMLSTKFKDKTACCNSDGSYKFRESYVRWWDTIRKVDILAVYIEEQNTHRAKIRTELRYYTNNGGVSKEYHTFILSADGDGNWLIYNTLN